MSWERKFFEPVPLPGGKEARTLRQAGVHVLALSKAERAHDTWQIVTDALRLVAEHKGDSMFGPIAKMAALDNDKPMARPSERAEFMTVKKAGATGRRR